jgi:hypothetical protein
MAVEQTRKQVEPDLKDLLDLHRKEIMLSMNCHAIATVQSFDSAKQTVTATINYKKTLFQDTGEGIYRPVLIDYPVLVDCPAIVLTGGAFSLKMPIQAGDTCVILFNDRDIDNWFQSGQVKEVNTGRLHSFADGLALVGVRSLANSLTGYADEMVVLGDGTHDLKVGDGEASINVGTTTVKAKTSKVRIANGTTTHNTLLADLITTINAITTTNCVVGAPVSLSPASISALNSIKTQIAGLLE